MQFRIGVGVGQIHRHHDGPSAFARCFLSTADVRLLAGKTVQPFLHATREVGITFLFNAVGINRLQRQFVDSLAHQSAFEIGALELLLDFDAPFHSGSSQSLSCWINGLGRVRIHVRRRHDSCHGDGKMKPLF